MKIIFTIFRYVFCIFGHRPVFGPSGFPPYCHWCRHWLKAPGESWIIMTDEEYWSHENKMGLF